MHLCGHSSLNSWAVKVFPGDDLNYPFLHDNTLLCLCFYPRSQIFKTGMIPPLLTQGSGTDQTKYFGRGFQTQYLNNMMRCSKFTSCLSSAWHVYNNLEICPRKPAEMLVKIPNTFRCQSYLFKHQGLNSATTEGNWSAPALRTKYLSSALMETMWEKPKQTTQMSNSRNMRFAHLIHRLAGLKLHLCSFPCGSTAKLSPPCSSSSSGSMLASTSSNTCPLLASLCYMKLLSWLRWVTAQKIT